MNNVHTGTTRLAKMAMLVAISVVLVVIVHFPLFPAAPYLEYDPADIPIFIGTFAFGPMAGVVLTVLVSVIQGTTVSAGSQIWGIIMHIMATGSFAVVAGNMYKHKKDRKSAVAALAAGVIVMTAVMCAANLVITPIYSGMPRETVAAMILPVILPFNLVKSGVNALITFFLYKRISPFLHK
ncbi:ECF transporter S component [Bacilliculturomica massiliensis]|uniref:ECF transporter S component n=1 Tax=Bacilliculturomica massiliensis TaxID=1917867 RepID=UPI00102F635E|nr:ECF transporter S component [Bacilliculturomica massiliensis]